MASRRLSRDDSMRVLHLTCNDARHAGGIALHRMHVALMDAGVDSRVLLGGYEHKSDSERNVPRSLGWRLADKPFRVLANYTGLHGIVRPSFRMWRRAINEFGPDIVHLHWTYSAYTTPMIAMRSLAADYPIVWTFHDMWAFTGGCTNSKGCARWMSGCGACPILADDEATGAMQRMPLDLTALQWKLKRAFLGRLPLTVVAPSAWMRDLAEQSPILGRSRVVCVPNPIDTGHFAPRDRAGARAALQIGAEDLILLFVGKPDNVYFYEGRVPLLLESLRLLQGRSPKLTARLSLLVIGGRGDKVLRASGLAGRALGAVSDEEVLLDCLSAADVMVNTTQFDNLPGIVQEGMSCGTPIVASDVGGLSDMLGGGSSGVLVDSCSPLAFATALEKVLDDSEYRQELGRRARARAQHLYDSGVVVPQMIAVYERACRGSR